MLFPPLLKGNLKGALLISHMSIFDTGMYSRREAAAAQSRRKKKKNKPVEQKRHDLNESHERCALFRGNVVIFVFSRQ